MRGRGIHAGRVGTAPDRPVQKCLTDAETEGSHRERRPSSGATMYRSILVPLDGSPSAEFAVPVAQGIARRCSGAVHLLRVHVPLSATASLRATPVPSYYRDWEAEAKGEEEEYLAALRQRCLGAGDATV